jgi:hypothetical protein
MTKEKLVNSLIKELEISNDINQSIIEIIVQSDYDIHKSKPKL